MHSQFPWLHAETHTHKWRVRGCPKIKTPDINPLTSPMCLLVLYLATNQGAVTQANGSRDSVAVLRDSAADTRLRVQEIPADSEAGILACASTIGKADSVGRGDCYCLKSEKERERETEKIGLMPSLSGVSVYFYPPVTPCVH